MNDKSIKVWDITTGRELSSLEGDRYRTSTIDISLDSKIIVSGSAYFRNSHNRIKIWDMVTGRELKSLEGHKDSISSIRISPDGKIIVSGARNGSIKVWDRKNGKLLKVLEKNTNTIKAFAISHDGAIVVSGLNDGSINVWDSKNSKLLKKLGTHTSYVNSVAISHDMSTIISGSYGKSIKVWDRKSGKLVKNLNVNKVTVSSLAISRDGNIIIAGLYNNTIKVWDKESGKLLKILEGHKSRVNSVAISQDRAIIISASDDKSIKIWDRKTGKLLKTLEGHEEPILSVVISRDGYRIISGSGDKTIKVWDRKTGKLLKTLKGHNSDIYYVATNYNGSIIVSGSGDLSIKIWDTQTGRNLKTLKGHYSIGLVAITDNGATTISGINNGNIKLWDTKTVKEKKEFRAEEGGTWIAFTYDTSKNYLNRGDNGTLLYKKDKNGNLSYALPKLPKKDFIELINTKKSISTINKQVYPYTLTIKNKANEKLYWLKTEYHDKYCTLLEQRISNLEARGEQNMTLNFNCSLPRENPKPINNHKINLLFETATKSKFTLPLSVSIRYADINVTKVEVSEDGKNLNVEIKNIGNETLIESDVNLSEPFQANIQKLTNLEANSTRILSFVIDNNFTFEENSTLNLNVYIPNEDSKSAVPLSEWHLNNIPIILNKTAWYIYTFGLISMLVLTWKIIHYRLYRHPLVLKLEKEPKSLLELPLEELKTVKEKLSVIERLESTLSENQVSKERFDEAIKYVESSTEEQTAYLAKRVWAKVAKLSDQADVLTLDNDFTLNVQKFIVFHSDKTNVADMMSDIKLIPQYSTQVIVILSPNSVMQEKLYENSRGESEKIIILQAKELTALLLRANGAKVLADIFSGQLALTQISPYKLGGGVINSSMFFGRAEIVSHILGRENANYILIGSRQIGKSSLLQAIAREYQKSTDNVHYISLNTGNVVQNMAKKLGVKVKGIEALVLFMTQSDERYIFLVDEADKFIKNEKEQGYEILNNFRKLSEEGRCHFIIAGFWELYEHAVLDYQSPLKNFGETIELGALEEEACREMIVKPMKQLGLRFENEDAVNEIVERTGRRANLIAIICNNIIMRIGKEKKVIGLGEVQEAIKEKNVYELFKSWRELNDDKRANRLDRIIVYATIEKGEFALAELIDLLKGHGLAVDIVDLEKSLDRLKVSYTLDMDDEGRYYYKLPLFREYVLKGAYEVKLREEVLGYV